MSPRPRLRPTTRRAGVLLIGLVVALVARISPVSSSDATRPTAGPTGSRTATATEPGARIGVLLALRPARAGG